MGRLLKLDAVVEVLEGAFRPFACTVSISPHRERIRFVVLDPSGAPILRPAARPGLEMRDPDLLRLRIDQARSRLRAEGFKIDRWRSSL